MRTILFTFFVKLVRRFSYKKIIYWTLCNGFIFTGKTFWKYAVVLSVNGRSILNLNSQVFKKKQTNKTNSSHFINNFEKCLESILVSNSVNEHDRPLFKSSYDTTHSIYHNCTDWILKTKMSTFHIFSNWHKLDVKLSMKCKHAQMSINLAALTLLLLCSDCLGSIKVTCETTCQHKKQNNQTVYSLKLSQNYSIKVHFSRLLYLCPTPPTMKNGLRFTTIKWIVAINFSIVNQVLDHW